MGTTVRDFVIREAMTFIIQAVVIAWLEQIINIDPVTEITEHIKQYRCIDHTAILEFR